MKKILFPVFAFGMSVLFCSCQPMIPAGTDQEAQEVLPTETPVPEDVAEAPGLPENRKQLLMHYMPWYKTPEVRGAWGSHWTGHEQSHHPDQLAEDGHPDIWSHYDPLIGLYDSADPDVLECQLLQMKLAGVDGVIVDWYGIGQIADYPMIHEATEVLFEQTGILGMSFSVCYEDRTLELKVKRDHLAPEQVGQHLTETIEWMQEHWFQSAQYFKIDGRPMLLNFGPVYLKDPAVWEAALSSVKPRPLFFALHHLWQKTAADGGFTWVHYSAWKDDATPVQVVENLNNTYTYYGKDPAQMIVSATPGFKDVYKNPHPVLPHRDGQTLQESLAVCMNGPWKVIQLVTWNDYGEGTMIEPTHQFGYRFLEIIQEARREELGEAFPYTPADLRLPGRLLTLRRKGEADPAVLDQIAQLLRLGKTEAARREMENL